MIPWEIVCEGGKWIEVALDRVKVRIFSEPVCYVTRILVKCKKDLSESVCKDGRCMGLTRDIVRWQPFELVYSQTSVHELNSFLKVVRKPKYS